MKTVLRSIALLSFLGLLLSRPVGLQAYEKDARGVIRGNLINGTAGERVAGLEVILKRYEEGRGKKVRKPFQTIRGSFLSPVSTGTRARVTSFTQYTRMLNTAALLLNLRIRNGRSLMR